MQNTFFVGWVKEYLDSPREDCSGYYESYHLSFVPEPEEYDWEHEFLSAVLEDSPVVGSVQVSGSLANPYDLEELDDWLQYTELKLGPDSQKIVDDAHSALGRTLPVSEQPTDEAISLLLSGNATESLAAFEGPVKDLLTSVGKGIATGVKKVASTLGSDSAKISIAQNAGQASNLFAASKNQIDAVLGGAKAVESRVSLADVIVYLTRTLLSDGAVVSSKQTTVACSALLQNPAGVRRAVDIAALMPSSTVEAFNAVAVKAADAHKNNQDYTPEKDVEKLLQEGQKRFLQLAEAALKAAVAELGVGTVVVGYSDNVGLVNKWVSARSSSSKSQPAFSLDAVDWKDQGVRAQLNNSWDALSTDQAARSRLLEKLLPKSIVAARDVIKTYFYQQGKPFTDWVWDILLIQAKRGVDPTAESITYLTSPKRNEVLKRVFVKHGLAGLNLSEGVFSATPADKGNVSQLALISTVAAKDDKLLTALRDEKGWKSLRAMNELFDNLTAQGGTFLAQLTQGAGFVTRDTLKDRYAEYTALNGDLFTESTWEVLQAKLAAAANVLNDPLSRSTQVVDAHTELTKAKKQLVAKSGTSPAGDLFRRPLSAARSAPAASISLDYDSAKKLWDQLDKSASETAAANSKSKAEFMQLFKEATGVS